MKITADTNLLVRAVVGDDPAQAEAAATILGAAELVAVPTAMLCELVWVLRRSYGFAPADIAPVIRALAASATVRLDRAATETGLAMLAKGGDFADGVIASEGAGLGGPCFVSFDEDARRQLASLGFETLAPDAGPATS